MNTVLIISKKHCAPCTSLKKAIESLPQEVKEKISVLDETTSTQDEIFKILNSYGSMGFPTIVLQGNPEKVITGYGAKTLTLITDHVTN